MFNRYYQGELTQLKELAGEFSRAHPALAPMLSGPTADPDVERLLEGVAFLTALLRQKLDDEFPEVIHDLMHLIWPHYLRPIPSTTLMAFSPKQTLKQSMKIPAGIYVASVPVEGTSCLFKTSCEVEIHPLTLIDASFTQPSGKAPVIKILLELNGPKLSDWQPQALRFFLAGDLPGATDLSFLLQRHLKQIMIKPLAKGTPVILPAESLKPGGFAAGEALIPYPTHSFPGYRILQEYFILPEKFLFLDLVGWERWLDRGDGSKFEIMFELTDLPFSPPRVRKENFALFVTPAINIFPHEAAPVLLEHRNTHSLIRPAGSNPGHYQVYSVEKVVGFVHGTAKERPYVPFELFSPDQQSAPAYHISRRQSSVHNGFDVYLSVAYPHEAGLPGSETLSIHLLCTNGSLAENLRVGDISQPTSSSPEFVEFKNIQAPTSPLLPSLGTNLLWQLISHLSLNYLSLARAENLQALLGLYIFPERRDRAATLANRKRIKGIENVEAKTSDRLVSGFLMRGQEIKLRMSQDNFSSQGDLFLFGCILDHFLGGYASINSYTSVMIQEIIKGDIYQWPARLGNHPL
ncbi:MAG: type VI secretion system baseplate subunit TssF, partial [Thermodesulfobacteriota bacterium]|nr:type VI secretion system baseplate subunit TssF [Thermodesulfobacteriota bacterium]